MSLGNPPGSSEHPAGSPKTGEPAFLVVGKLLHPHGVRGEILMDVITDFPERLQPGVGVYVGEDHRLLQIRSRRLHRQDLLLTFDGYSTPETVGELRNLLVYVPSHDRPALPDGEYYHHQLIGLQVFSEEGSLLGKLENILITGANDIYVVRSPQGGELLLPAIEEVVQEIDLDARKIIVRLLPGLLDL
jgi:16S rRNA processing protein RimM